MKAKLKEITAHAKQLSQKKILAGCKIGEQIVEHIIADGVEEVKSVLSIRTYIMLKDYVNKEQWADFVILGEYNINKL